MNCFGDSDKISRNSLHRNTLKESRNLGMVNIGLEKDSFFLLVIFSLIANNVISVFLNICIIVLFLLALIIQTFSPTMEKVMKLSAPKAGYENLGTIPLESLQCGMNLEDASRLSPPSPVVVVPTFSYVGSLRNESFLPLTPNPYKVLSVPKSEPSYVSKDVNVVNFDHMMIYFYSHLI